MPLTNQSTIEDAMHTEFNRHLGKALRALVDEMITTELPKGKASSIAGEIEVKNIGRGHFVVRANDVWVWLNDGTGIFNPEHAGQGPGGEIVAHKQKRQPKGARTGGQYTYGFRQVLHFKNAKLAAALGFPGEDVFLKSVKGIQPRFYFDRYFRAARISEALAKV